MCATCVAQGAVYVGGATVVLQGLAHRARRRVARTAEVPVPTGPPDAAGDARDARSTEDAGDAPVALTPRRRPG